MEERAWRRYYIVQLPLGGTQATAMKGYEVLGADVSGILEAIEKVGWTLRDIGYVYQPLAERSHALTDSAHMMASLAAYPGMMRRTRERLGLRECRAAWLLGLTVVRRLAGGADLPPSRLDHRALK